MSLFSKATPVVAGSGTVGTVTFASNVAAGSAVFVDIAIANASQITPTVGPDASGNTYSLVSGPNIAQSMNHWVYASLNVLGGFTAIPITFASSFFQTCALEYTGMASASILDKSAASSVAAGNTPLSVGPTPTTTQAKEVLLALNISSSNGTHSYTAGTGYTIRKQNADAGTGFQFVAEDQEVSATGAYSAGLTGLGANDNSNFLLLTLKQSVHSISGNAGIANANVSYSSNTTNVGGNTTADGSGNYVINGLTNDTYTVGPWLVGQYFTLGTQAVVVSGANVTGINFTATAAKNFSALTYTQTRQDTFVRANENPLNPTNWTVVSGLGNLQIVSNVCEGTLIGSVSAENYTAVAWPDDVYVEMKIASLTADLASDAGIYARADVNVSTSYVSVDVFNIGGGLYNLEVLDQTAALVMLNVVIAASANDVFRMAFSGSQGALFKNGTVIANFGNLQTLSGTFGGLLMLDHTAASDVKISNFAFGTVTSGGSGGGGEGAFGFGYDYKFRHGLGF